MYTGAAQADVKTEAVNVNNVTYYAFLRVYTLICSILMVSPSPISGKHSYTRHGFNYRLHFCIT